MDDKQIPAKVFLPFSKSHIWTGNKEYYKDQGLEAWRSDVVPHQASSNSRIAKTIAELILGYLKDIASKGSVLDTVYIIELGAGHGRLAYHILKHLDRLIQLTIVDVPKYCYVLTDIIEESLDYFLNHSQFENYLNEGKLDVSYFDLVNSDELFLRKSKKKISSGSLVQSTIVIANYVLDSIGTDLFHIQEGKLNSCHVSADADYKNEGSKLSNRKLEFLKEEVVGDYYEKEIYNSIIHSYKELLNDSHFYFPIVGLDCLTRIRQLSNKGAMVISCDKGHHEINDLQNIGEPDLIMHGSFSIWVNYHAIGKYCEKNGGRAYLPSYATNELQCVCLLFEVEHDSFQEVNNAYERFVNDFGPDDYVTLKKMSYDKIDSLKTEELIAMIRLSNYDSTIFKNYLPKLKQLAAELSMSDRRRLAQTMHKVWDTYFTIHEPFDLPFELGGFFFDLSFYEEALFYFGQSIKLFGPKADTYYNMILCHYQLREDLKLKALILKAKQAFPAYVRFSELDKLDLKAV